MYWYEVRETAAITGPNYHICKQLLYENGLRSDIDINIIIEDEKQAGAWL
jgi:hypothetical protein